MQGILSANILMQLASLFGGFTYYVDESCVYHHGPLYWIYLVFIIAVLVMMLYGFFQYSKRHSRRNSSVLLCMVFIIVFGVAAQTISSDIRTINLSMTMAMVLFLLHFEEFEQQELSKEVEQTEELVSKRERAVQALVGNYLTAHYIDLENQSLEAVVSTEVVDTILSQKSGLQEKFNFVMSALTTPSYMEQMMAFIDLDTLADRLSERSIISLEFVGQLHGWCRASFLVVDRNDAGLVKTVLFTTNVIEEEKQYEAELLALSTVDSLTGLSNQRAYLQMMDALSDGVVHSDLVVLSLDVNGLKEINDTYGHSAGDDLLKGAASCVKKAFGEIGDCYRMGGDELVVISEQGVDAVKAAIENLSQQTNAWTHPVIPELNISCGYACAGDFPDLTVRELMKKADEDMYAAKRRYYEQSGHERRVRH